MKMIKRFTSFILAISTAIIFTFSFTLVPVSAKEDTSSVDLTDEEKEYISSIGTLKVGVNASRTPFAEYDSDTGTYTGINIDILDEISKITGLQFEYVTMTPGKKVVELFEDDDYDIICGIERDNFAGNDAFFVTDAFMESAIVPVGKSGETIDMNGDITVTFPSSFAALQKVIEKEYPNATIKTLTDNRECLDAVVSGEADVFIQNTYILSRLLQEPKYENLDILPVLNSIEISRYP